MTVFWLLLKVLPFLLLARSEALPPHERGGTSPIAAGLTVQLRALEQATNGAAPSFTACEERLTRGEQAFWVPSASLSFFV